MVAIGRRLTGRKATGQQEPDETIYAASQWRLMWIKFRHHRLAVIGSVVVFCLYFMAVFNGFFSTYDPLDRAPFPYASYHGVHFIHDGKIEPFVYGITLKTNSENFTRTIAEDTTKIIPVKFFAAGPEYKLIGLISMNIHFVQPEKGGYIFWFGTDKLGRDVFSRTLSGATISLSIGLLGVLASFMLGSILGGFSGFYGGVFDTVVQRIIEFLISMPTIPLWMALSAAIPPNWSPIQVYFAITLILSLRGWCGLARVVRGKMLQVREEDFVLEAKLGGASDWRIVTAHLLPSFISYLIVDMTLAIPDMILGETSLSFLGLGLRPPVVSWGVLLQDAQNIRTVATSPWLLTPALFVVVTVLAFNFMGDGLRDAADPYKV